MTKAYWVGLDPDNRDSLWDCAIVCDLLDGKIWTPKGYPKFEHTADLSEIEPGSVFIVPGADYQDRVDELNALLGEATPAIVMIVKDEACHFPWERLRKKGVALWVQNPDPEKHDHTVRGFPVGWTPKTRDVASLRNLDKPLDWFYSGSCAHYRRKSMFKHLKNTPNGEMHATSGFAQGMPQLEYLAKMASCKVAPCPGGVITPDSFRAWEALELGCYPLVDTVGGRGAGAGYWQNLLGEAAPFPIMKEWQSGGALIAKSVERWPANVIEVGSWWQSWKRHFVQRFHDDLRDITTPCHRPGDRITVLLPTSSIPSNPDTAFVEEAIRSVRCRPELDGCEIIVTADGLRETHTHRKGQYDEFKRRLLALAGQTHNTMVMVFDKPCHQSEMAKAAMDLCETPAVLYVEHDTPMIAGDVPWEGMIDAVLRDDVDLIRMHHEANVLECHMHLMPDGIEVQHKEGVPMVRTIQWSQRPHVANADYYRRILTDYFDRSMGISFIEDRMHGVIEAAWKKHGNDSPHKLWMFHPEGCIKRSTHTDGRAGEEKAPT